MEAKKTFELKIDGDRLNKFIKGRIAGIIVGVTNNPDTFRSPIIERTETTGLWIFKRTKIISATYTFDATYTDICVIDELVKRSYNHNGMRDFGYGIKQVGAL